MGRIATTRRWAGIQRDSAASSGKMEAGDIRGKRGTGQGRWKRTEKAECGHGVRVEDKCVMALEQRIPSRGKPSGGNLAPGWLPV